LVKNLAKNEKPQIGAFPIMTENSQMDRVQNICIAMASVFWALMVFIKGVKFSPDSDSYSKYGDLLIKYDFNYFDFLAHTEDVTPIALYSAWITIVAITKVIFGANWGIAIVAINYIAAVYTLILILKATRMVTGSQACIIFISVALIFCYDFYMWIRYVLSDTLFASICFTMIFLSISLFHKPSEPQKRIAIGVILFGISLFFRPTSPPLVVFIFLSILFGCVFKLGTSDANQRDRLIKDFTLVAFVALSAVLLIHSYIMLNPENWPFPFFKTWIHIVASDYELGIVVYARPETYHSIPIGIPDYLLITLSKLIAFFAFDFDGYSKMHALMNYIFFLPIYALSIFSIALLYKKESGLSPINWWTIFSCFIFVALFAFFHSLQQIDYDLRYRVPCLLPLVLLATLGFNEFMIRFSKKNSS
jgi:hypothetical protein